MSTLEEQNVSPTMNEEDWEDRIKEDGVKLFPVFCTAEISSETLTDFLKRVRSGLEALDEPRMSDVGFGLCILQSNDTSSITHGSRYPYEAFSSPYLGKSIAEVEAIWLDKVRGNPDEESNGWTDTTFFILDDQTAKDGRTCILASNAPDGTNESSDEDGPGGLQTVRVEFEVAMYHASGLEGLSTTFVEVVDGRELLTFKDVKDSDDAAPDPYKNIPR